MMGLMVLLFFAVYLAVSLWVIFAVLNWAAKHKRSGWWGVLAVFVMYNLVFWDLIPTLAAHKYYCETQAGFWVYKTPEQWKVENPEVIETFVVAPPERRVVPRGFADTYYLNRHMIMLVKQYQINSIIPIHRLEQEVTDSKNSQVLARYTDFFSGYGSLGTGGDGSWRVLKYWLRTKQCAGRDARFEQFLKFKRSFEGTKK